MGLPRGADGDRVVVVGLSGSDASWRAVAYAVGLARRQDALLVVVHVLPVHVAAALAGAAWMLSDTDRIAAGRMERRIAAGLAGMSEARSLRWDFEVLPPGDVLAGISDAADRCRADTVVVGTSSRLRRRFGGAVGVKLVRVRRWPVLVVP